MCVTDFAVCCFCVFQWVCQFCTYLNYSPATMCEMCDLTRPEPPPLPVKLRPPSPVRRVPALPIKPKKPASEDADSWRQKRMKEEGEKLIHLIRACWLHRLFPHECLSLNPNMPSCVLLCLSGRRKERPESRRGVHKHEGL